MKILLTGASSDTGLKLTKKLIENLNNFDELYLITNSNPIVQKKDLNKSDKIKIINQKLLNTYENEMNNALKKIDILIHIAWIRPNKPSRTTDLNINGIKKISNNLNKRAKVIYLSSVSGIPSAMSFYGKSKFETSKILFNSYDTCLFVCGLIITDNKNSPFFYLKRTIEKMPLLIKFGNKIRILYTDSDNVITEIYNKIFNFKKGIHKLYNDEDVTLDDFIKINFDLKKKIYINLGLFINLFLIFLKFINYIPFINKITDRLITLLTNDKKKTDEFVEGNFI